MPRQPFHIDLNKAFPKSNKEQWLRIASQELSEKNPLQKLSWEIGNLKFYPYYEEEDVKSLRYLEKFNVPPADPTSNVWQNLPSIKVSEEKKANALALEYLEYGADGILFDLTTAHDADIDALLNKITWPYCNISFLCNNHKNVVIKIVTHIRKNNYDPTSLRGSIFWKSRPEKSDPEKSETCVQEMIDLQNFYPLGIFVQQSAPANEITNALLMGVSQMDYLTSFDVDKEDAFRRISVSLPCDENFLVNIAKMKAMRTLWYQIANAFEIKNFKPQDLHLHARTEKWIQESFQPHGNMVNNTYGALASVLGGCNSLTLEAEDEHNATMNRAALHVSNILREESHLDKVSNGIAGAYTIDRMVDELARASWANFQQAVSV